jgi:chorismate synthase
LEHGNDVFRDFERRAVEEVSASDWKIVIIGGGAFMDPASRRLLRDNALILYLVADTKTLWARATENGLPPWLDVPDGQEKFAEEVAFRDEVMRPFADAIIDTESKEPEALALACEEAIQQEIVVRQRGANTYGDIIRVTSFGESHGKGIGCILDGVRPGIEIAEDVIQKQMERRKPGQSKVVTQRKEPDTVEILSGIFEGKTTGAPIAMVIRNTDHDSTKYDEVKDLFRPGHADFTFYKKYGHRDHRGGGRSSGRETATRVASGAVAMEILRKQGVTLHAYALEVAGIRAQTCDYSVIEDNPVRCADPIAAKKMEDAILAARKDTDSVGGIIQLDILGVPPGLGDPVFGKLDARLADALMSIGAFKGVEVGGGFGLVHLRGSESNDRMEDGGFASNNAGGITGGISTGQTIVMRVAVKPTASIAKSQPTIGMDGENHAISVGGRHDPCIVPRAVPVIENMCALTILDAWEVQARLNPDWDLANTRMSDES